MHCRQPILDNGPLVDSRSCMGTSSVILVPMAHRSHFRRAHLVKRPTMNPVVQLYRAVKLEHCQLSLRVSGV